MKRFLFSLLTLLLLDGCTPSPETAGAESQSVAPYDAKVMAEKLRRLASRGDAKAQYHLGMFYNNGLVGDGPDPLRAMEWFEKSAAGGDPLAHYKLGCYHHGQWKILPKDSIKALEHYRVAAEAGYSRAQFGVASLLLEQNSTREALPWLEAAGEQGDVFSLGTLFTLYNRGEGVARDDVRAYRYLLLTLKADSSLKSSKTDTLQEELAAVISPEAIREAEEAAAAWSPKPGALTLEANSGFRAVQHFLAQNAGSIP